MENPFGVQTPTDAFAGSGKMESRDVNARIHFVAFRSLPTVPEGEIGLYLQSSASDVDKAHKVLYDLLTAGNQSEQNAVTMAVVNGFKNKREISDLDCNHLGVRESGSLLDLLVLGNVSPLVLHTLADHGFTSTCREGIIGSRPDPNLVGVYNKCGLINHPSRVFEHSDTGDLLVSSDPHLPTTIALHKRDPLLVSQLIAVGALVQPEAVQHATGDERGQPHNFALLTGLVNSALERYLSKDVPTMETRPEQWTMST